MVPALRVRRSAGVTAPAALLIGLAGAGEASATILPPETNGGTVLANASTTVIAFCPPGAHVVGGGVHITGSSLEVEVRSSAPFDGEDADSTPDDA